MRSVLGSVEVEYRFGQSVYRSGKVVHVKWSGNDFGVIKIFLAVISSDADKLRHYWCVGLQESV